MFGKRDIGRIEREFLDVLDFELGISEKDVDVQRGHLFAAVPSSVPPQLRRPIRLALPNVRGVQSRHVPEMASCSQYHHGARTAARTRMLADQAKYLSGMEVRYSLAPTPQLVSPASSCGSPRYPCLLTPPLAGYPSPPRVVGSKGDVYLGEEMVDRWKAAQNLLGVEYRHHGSPWNAMRQRAAVY